MSYGTCGITTAGTVACWGDNDYNVVVNAPTSGTCKEIGAGGYHACALSSAGIMTCVNGEDGQKTPLNANTTYPVW